jgi:signal transduction histidine kinase/HAMP domain-containing protein
MNDTGATRVVDVEAAVPRAPQPRGRLFRKYVALFVAVVAIALLANGLLEIWFSYREHQESLVRIQHEQAEAAAAKIGQFIKEIESQLGWTTQLPWSSATLEQRRVDALRLLRQVPAITELTQLDSKGHEQLRVSRLAMDVVGSGADLSNEPKFAEAVAHKVYYGPVYFRRESEPYMTLSLAGTSRAVGVSVAEVNLKFIWDVVSQIKVGEHGQAFVIDRSGRLIAHPDISLVLRNTDLTSLAQVKAALAGSAGASLEEAQEARDLRGHRVLSAHARVEPLGWNIFVELPLEEAYGPLYASIERSGILLLGGLILAFLAGLLLARRMVVPIERLRTGAARLGRGELSERIAIKTGDELETLANQFNDMAGQLQESYADLENKVEQRTHELSESLEQQTATADVLKLISRSTFDLKPVLGTLIETAARLCNAEAGNIWRQEGDRFQSLGSYGLTEEVRRFIAESHPAAGRGTLVGRTVIEGRPIHIHDVRQDPEYTWSEAVERAGLRTMLGVPLMRQGVPIGAFSLHRLSVHPFTEKQIELVTTFADQAVIAMENVRLLTELRESLEQQTATADVLRVISNAPGELQPVFDAILANATRICEAQFGMLSRRDGDLSHTLAMQDVPRAYADYLGTAPRRLSARTAAVRSWLTKQAVQVLDARNNPPYLDREADAVALVELGGARSIIAVPLLKDDEPIGTITIYRQEVRPFTDKQIELVTGFAAQAVIAMENARLITETREALERQTATTEVLRVISSSPGELQPVFDAILANAARICEAKFGTLNRYDALGFHAVASLGVPPAFAEYMRQRPHMTPTQRRVVETKQTAHVVDLMTEQAYRERDPDRMAIVDLAGARTLLLVPMLKETEIIGGISIYRQEVRPFTEKQIELVTSFAAQAVIAIENVRLLNELRDRTTELARSVEELRALGEVSQAVNSTLEVDTVLQTIVTKAVQLSRTDAGAIYVFDEAKREFLLQATYGMDAALIDAIRHQHLDLGEHVVGQAARTRAPAQVADLHEDAAQPIQSLIVRAGFRALLVVPLLSPDGIVGALVVRRRSPGEFAGTTIDLLQTFAAQSVVAMQNARLFAEIEEKGRQLELASRHKSQFLANMSHELRTPLNAVLGYSEMMLDGLYGDMPEKAKGVLERVQANGKHLLGLINDVLDLSKIEAGQLSLAIEDYSMSALVKQAVATTESLARTKGLALTAQIQDGLPKGRGDERRLTQVLLNLIGNAVKFTDKGEVAISAEVADGRFTVAVRDTGPGIAEADQARIFEEFQQVDNTNTRKKGGTGLGLAIAKRIMEMHGGTLTVQSVVGEGSIFRMILPVRAAQGKEAA